MVLRGTSRARQRRERRSPRERRPRSTEPPPNLPASASPRTNATAGSNQTRRLCCPTRAHATRPGCGSRAAGLGIRSGRSVRTRPLPGSPSNKTSFAGDQGPGGLDATIWRARHRERFPLRIAGLEFPAQARVPLSTVRTDRRVLASEGSWGVSRPGGSAAIAERASETTRSRSVPKQGLSMGILRRRERGCYRLPPRRPPRPAAHSPPAWPPWPCSPSKRLPVGGVRLVSVVARPRMPARVQKRAHRLRLRKRPRGSAGPRERARYGSVVENRGAGIVRLEAPGWPVP